MSEYKIPIPSMLYNAAIGGHVTNSQQIIDENLNREQQDINEEVTAVPYNASNPNGMGKIVLKKNDNFKQVVEAQTNGNTIFVIKYDFTLTDNITIPINCVLEFAGGSISGTSILTFQNTELKGIYGSINGSLGLAGTIKGLVNVGFWNIKSDDASYDNGIIFNKVTSVFRRIYIPSGVYYFSTPILMQKMERIEADADLYYNGIATNISAIKITRSNGIFNFNGVISCVKTNNYPIYTKTDNTKIIGLEFNSSNNSELRFHSIMDFNEGLRVSDTNSTGCCYNTFYLGVIINANYHVRVYQQNSPSGSISWCNQNLFIGGRCLNYTGWDYSDATHCVCFYFYGGKADGKTDSYNNCNNITIIGTCTEMPNNANYYLVNCIDFRIINTRHESAKIPVKCVGNCRLVFEPGYGNDVVDLSEASYVGVNKITPKIVKNLTNEYTEITVNDFRYISLGTIIKGRFFIKYLDDENGEITDDTRPDYPNIGTMYYHSINKALISGNDTNNMIFKVPDGITKIAIATSNVNMTGSIIIGTI